MFAHNKQEIRFARARLFLDPFLIIPNNRTMKKFQERISEISSVIYSHRIIILKELSTCFLSSGSTSRILVDSYFECAPLPSEWISGGNLELSSDIASVNLGSFLLLAYIFAGFFQVFLMVPSWVILFTTMVE